MGFISCVERPMQDDFGWDVGGMGDMCEEWGADVRRGAFDMENYDEQAEHILDSALVERGEKTELERFNHIIVYGYVSRDQGLHGQPGKTLKVKWVRMKRGDGEHPEVRCRRVAHKLGCVEARKSERCALSFSARVQSDRVCLCVSVSICMHDVGTLLGIGPFFFGGRAMRGAPSRHCPPPGGSEGGARSTAGPVGRRPPPPPPTYQGVHHKRCWWLMCPCLLGGCIEAPLDMQFGALRMLRPWIGWECAACWPSLHARRVRRGCE